MEPAATRHTSIVALMAVFGLGICFVIVGAVSEEYKAALGLTNADLGNLTLALFLTSSIVQLIIGPLVDKFGYKPVATVGFLVAALSMVLLKTASSADMAVLACILLGVGAMCLNTVGNTLIPVVLFNGQDPARASNFGNAFFGLGLVVTPLLFALVNWQLGLYLLGGLFLIGLLLALTTRFPRVSTGYEFSMAFKLLGKPAVIVAALALFCYISLEASMNTWSKPYMTELLGGTENPAAVQNAGFVLSLFGVAMMVGRFATSAIKNLTAIGVRLIGGAALVAVGAILVMIMTSSAGVATAAVVLTGLVFAPIFPTIVGVTFAKFEARLYGSIFGIMFSVGLLGATFVPKIIGNLSAGATVQQSLLIVLAMAAALVVISLLLNVGAKAHAAVRTTLVVAIACLLAGTTAVAQQKPQGPPKPQNQQSGLRLNDREYFDTRGLNVLVFTNQYNGMFFDEKTAGIEIILHGVRLATGGAVRLSPTPEQWDLIPKVVDRKVDRATNTITCVLRYEAFDFNSRLEVTPEGAGFRVAVYVDKAVPEKLEGRAGFNLEFLPSKYFERTYLADGRPGIFPRYPTGPTETRPGDTKIPQFEGYSTFDDRGRNEYVEAHPVAVGKRLVLAPEDPERRISIQALSGELQLLDGRNLAQNGWFIVRSLLSVKTTGKVAEWVVRPNIIPDWTRTPVIGFSQVGYHPAQKKVAIIELDSNDTALPTASLFEVTPDGAPVERLKVKVQAWGSYLRYQYVAADFSTVNGPGLYYIEYGRQKTETFPIGPSVYDTIWHATADVWFPVQMDHMFVNEAYRVWHGLPHMDDALQAPLNFQHFDGYRMGASTETKYKPLERIPGLAVGGWFDAGDFDIQDGSHAGTIMSFVDTWEAFRPLRDQTFIDQASRFVDIHRPDGKPDLLQQIEHGALQMAAQYRAFGRAVRGIVDSHLHRYQHLGDASTQTDNLIFDPSLKPYQVEGNRSGTPDDRWVFTDRTPSTNYSGIGSLAAASRALRGFNDALADECLALAKQAYADERQTAATTPPTGFEATFGQGAELAAVLQLSITTKEQQYIDRFNELIWPSLDRPGGRGLLIAVKALPYLGPGALEKLRPYVVKYKAEMDGLSKANPYGVPIATGGWAGSGGVVGWASTNYYLHKAYPDLIDRESVYRGLYFLFGTHPASNTSFVATVGTRSKHLAYGSNRADFTFIPGVIVPGVLILKPDYPENMDDWPFLWGENEGTIGGASQYIFLAHAANDLLGK